LAELLIEGTDYQNSRLSGLVTAAFFGIFNWISEILNMLTAEAKFE